jgi:hypothetical protein
MTANRPTLVICQSWLWRDFKEELSVVIANDKTGGLRSKAAGTVDCSSLAEPAKSLTRIKDSPDFR